MRHGSTLSTAPARESSCRRRRLDVAPDDIGARALSQPNLEGKNGPEQFAAIGETAAVFRDERVDDAAVDVRRCAAVRCEQRKEIAVDPFARRRREADLRTMYRLARKKVIGD